MRTALACLAGILLSACSDPAGVAGSGDVHAAARSTSVDIHNSRPLTIYTFVVDRETAALILWAPCDDPKTCDGIESGETRNVAGADIMGWGESAEVIVYWWHLIPEARGGFRPDSIRGIVTAR